MSCFLIVELWALFDPQVNPKYYLHINHGVNEVSLRSERIFTLHYRKEANFETSTAIKRNWNSVDQRPCPYKLLEVKPTEFKEILT